MIKAIVTDIEGTTSSLSFVHDVLFPYARANLAEFVQLHQNDPEVAVLLADVARLAEENLDIEALIALLISWIDADKKITPLKSLQGLIWAAGYKSGAYKGHIYPDAVNNLQQWKALGLDLYVYSSGSVFAQKLLFAHTEFGDLTGLFSGYFDTQIGAKRESSAYAEIARQLGLTGRQIVFLSDIKEELDAAALAEFNTVWLVRGQQPNAQAEHKQVNSFDQITLTV
ncbi:MAG: acireductone synthase [Methylococcaceae bacterium]|jgi:enolase-phosphatase E1